MVQDVRNKVFRLWFHFWLRRIANKFPNFFVDIIHSLGVSKRAEQVMYWRYIQHREFEEIPQIIFTSKENVYKLHQKVIDKLINI